MHTIHSKDQRIMQKSIYTDYKSLKVQGSADNAIWAVYHHCSLNNDSDFTGSAQEWALPSQTKMEE